MFEFSKQQRLLRRLEYTNTMDNGVKIVTHHLVMIGRRNGGNVSRVGFIVSKKLGGAVTRNRVRRRLRELYRTLPNKPKDLDIVIIARYGAVKADFEALGQTLSYAFGKLEARLAKAEADSVPTV